MSKVIEGCTLTHQGNTVKGFRSHHGQAEVVVNDAGQVKHLVLADVLRGVRKGTYKVGSPA